MAKYKNKERQFDEMDQLTSNVIEVIGEERLLEHILLNMMEEDRRDLACELAAPVDLSTDRAQEAYTQNIKNDIERLELDNSAGTRDKFITYLIWELVGGQDGPKD